MFLIDQQTDLLDWCLLFKSYIVRPFDFIILLHKRSGNVILNLAYAFSIYSKDDMEEKGEDEMRSQGSLQMVEDHSRIKYCNCVAHVKFKL